MKTRKEKRCKTCGKVTRNVTFLCNGCEKIKQVSESNRPETYNRPVKILPADPGFKLTCDGVLHVSTSEIWSSQEQYPCTCGEDAKSEALGAEGDHTPTPREILGKLKKYEPINAEEFSFIVRAVNEREALLAEVDRLRNSHDEMLELLKRIEKEVMLNDVRAVPWLDDVTSLRAKAEGR